MKYIYEVERRNYEDFSSGRVLYNQKGATSFPVRLTREIFLRSKEYLNNKNVKSPFSIYDPCCGGAYLLTSLGFLHSQDISKIVATDIDKNILDLAKRNLSLLTLGGINKRIEEIKEYILEFDKPSHRDALESAIRLKAMIENTKKSIDIECYQADSLNITISEHKVDLLICDVPYGNIVSWSNSRDNNLEVFLQNMLKVIKPASVLAIITDKNQIVKHKSYNRMKHFTIGKRRVTFLEPI